MNYKLTTIILAGILILCIGWQIGSAGRHAEYRDHKKMMMEMMGGEGMSMMSKKHDMKNMMDGMTQNLQGKTGDALDKAFLTDMIVHHQGAVDMAKELQKGTKRPELQKMANDIIQVQTKEIDMMQKWLSEWFK